MKLQAVFMCTLAHIYSASSQRFNIRRETIRLFRNQVFWQTLPAQEKEERIMEMVNATAGLRGNFPPSSGLILTDDLNPSFAHNEDRVPYTREKRAHSVGYIAAVEFNSTGNHQYTGLFEGAPYGVVRLSSSFQQSPSGIGPGLAVKLFRDGMPSVNLFGLIGLDGQPGGNFFEFNLSNHIPDDERPPDDPLIKKFESTALPANMLGLSEVAVVSTNGTAVPPGDVKYPFQLIFQPDEMWRTAFSSVSAGTDLLVSFSQIPSGSVLYQVLAVSEPNAAPTHIGELVTKSAIMDTLFGDRFLFFQHECMERDLLENPDWAIAMSLNETLCPFLSTRR